MFTHRHFCLSTGKSKGRLAQQCISFVGWDAGPVRTKRGFFCHHPSPAYDLTWSTVSFGEHSTTVDDNGKNPGVKEVVAVGRAAGMSSKACRKIAGELRERTRVPEEAVRDARC